jgi:hypothetical protein
MIWGPFPWFQIHIEILFLQFRYFFCWNPHVRCWKDPFLVLLNPIPPWGGGSRAVGRLDREGRLCGRVRDCEVRTFGRGNRWKHHEMIPTKCLSHVFSMGF